MKTAIKYTLYLGLALVVERINERLEKRRIRSIRASDIAATSITTRITAPKLSLSASTITAKNIVGNTFSSGPMKCKLDPRRIRN